MYSASIPWLWFAAGAGMLGAAVAADVKSQRIPNAIVAGGITGALLLAALPGGVGLSDALLGLAAGFAVLLPLHLLGVMGAGDVKLLAAVGAFVGYPGVLGAALATFIVGGVLSLAWAARSRSVRQVFANLWTGLFVLATDVIARRRTDPGTIPVSNGRVPYAIAIAGGAVVQVLLAGAPGAGGAL